MGDLSAHFSRSEFACHHCGVARVDAALVRRLEALRSICARPLHIVSGYRCTIHNAAVGGAPSSKHLVGQAADLRTGVCSVDQARRAGFTGIGTRGRWVVHVDVRPGRAVVFPDP